MVFQMVTAAAVALEWVGIGHKVAVAERSRSLGSNRWLVAETGIHGVT